jgi:hypothetical protein
MQIGLYLGQRGIGYPREESAGSNRLVADHTHILISCLPHSDDSHNLVTLKVKSFHPISDKGGECLTELRHDEGTSGI